MNMPDNKRYNGAGVSRAAGGHFSRPSLLLAGLAVLCLVSVPLACAFGSLRVEFADVFRVLFSTLSGTPVNEGAAVLAPGGLPQPLDPRSLTLVVADLRLPRAILSLAAGAGLAVSGAVFQGILRNPLADPFTLGVSGGAAFGAALAISLGLTGAFFGFGLPLAAFAGAAAALGAVLVLGRIGGGFQRETLVLAGVVVSAFLAALIALVKALDEASVTGIVFWIMGSFQGRGWSETALLAPGLFVGGGAAFLLRRELDMLSLGDQAARHLGLAAARTRLILLLAAGAITAGCVAVSGIIGFVGLIVPHLCRLVLGAEHRRLLPAAALCGGLLLLWSDTAARSLLPGGVELPVGVITALLGGPFFCFILGKKPSASAAPPLAGLELPEPETADTGFSPAAPCSSPLRADPPAHVVCKDLSFAYGRPRHRRPALESLSLVLPQGAFVGLLGPNGSGKSTLLRCLAGALSPQAGQVLVLGRPIAQLSERRRARLAAMLPQRPEAVPALTAFAIVLMGRYAHTPFLGGYGKEDRIAARRALEETGAAHLAGRSADTLSGGELQRVLLARALAQNAPLLLLDEAVAGLDPACQTAVLDSLARRNRADGLTVIAALHDLNLAALYCERLIFLKQGRIAADGPTERIFTAQTLGEVYENAVAVVSHPAVTRPQALLTPGKR